MLHLTEAQIRHLIGPEEAYRAVKEAFAALARNEVLMPPPIGLELTDRHGEVYLKGAYVQGTPYYAFKVASGFYDNPSKGLPTGAGVVMVFDAWTGMPAALLQDNGYLTEMRTGAAGALSCDLLARSEVAVLGMVGAGHQARFQLKAVARVRQFEQVLVWSRSPETVAGFIADVEDELPLEYRVVDTADEAVSHADVAITVTPSRSPLVSADALHSGLHITCVGSDGPGKQELDARALHRVDRLFVDHLEQAAEKGELQHALAEGILTREDVTGTLGHLVAVLKEGRRRAEDITLCDLTGVGVQDSAIASLTVELAHNRGVGRQLGGIE